MVVLSHDTHLLSGFFEEVAGAAFTDKLEDRVSILNTDAPEDVDAALEKRRGPWGSCGTGKDNSSGSSRCFEERVDPALDQR